MSKRRAPAILAQNEASSSSTKSRAARDGVESESAYEPEDDDLTSGGVDSDFGGPSDLRAMENSLLSKMRRDRHLRRRGSLDEEEDEEYSLSSDSDSLYEEAEERLDGRHRFHH